MRLDQLEQYISRRRPVSEANVAAKIKDPKTIKMLGIAMRHDGTLPKERIAKLGPKPDEASVIQLWSDILDDALRSTEYGDISADGKFDDWLTRLYINGALDYEDIDGEGGDALGAWKALSVRGKLKEPHQDFNKFRSLSQIQSLVRERGYRDELARIKDSERIEIMKKDAKSVTVYDDGDYDAIVPLNYGACYVRDKSGGYVPNFCTSSSSGERWFSNYAPDGMIVNVVDKKNADDVNGKWQFHASSNQLVNAAQENRGNLRLNDENFSKLFPGLMAKVIAGIQANAEAITAGSQHLTNNGYDIGKEIAAIKSKFPLSVASKIEKPDEESPEEEPNQDVDDGAGTYLVTQIASGRSARIQGESRQDVVDKLIRKYPDSSEADYTIEFQRE